MIGPLELRGEYRLQAFKDGTLERDSGWFPNLITKNGLNLLSGDINSWHHYIHLGSSNAAPVFTDTSLTDFTVSGLNASGFTSAIDTNNNWVTWHKAWTFPVGQAKGVIREIGLGATANNNLFSKAIVKDVKGNPTEFFVYEDEELVVNYTLFIKQPLEIFSSVVDGRAFTIAPKLINTNQDQGWRYRHNGGFLYNDAYGDQCNYGDSALTGFTLAPVTPGNFSANLEVDPYVTDSFRRVLSLEVNNVTETVVSFSTLVWVQGVSSWQMTISPPIVINPQAWIVLKFGVSWAEMVGVPDDYPR